MSWPRRSGIDEATRGVACLGQLVRVPGGYAARVAWGRSAVGNARSAPRVGDVADGRGTDLSAESRPPDVCDGRRVRRENGVFRGLCRGRAEAADAAPRTVHDQFHRVL